jgi:hypothetical protein
MLLTFFLGNYSIFLENQNSRNLKVSDEQVAMIHLRYIKEFNSKLFYFKNLF